MKKYVKKIKPVKSKVNYEGLYIMPSDGKTRKIWMSQDLLSVEGECLDCMSKGKLKMYVIDFERMLRGGSFVKAEEGKVSA